MKYNKLTAFLLTFAILISVFACNTMANNNFEFGSNKVNLQPSTYSLPVKMMKHQKSDILFTIFCKAVIFGLKTSMSRELQLI